MTTSRYGEKGQAPCRTERFFKLDTYWYYTTREGVSIGPFDDRESAKSGCDDFVDYMMAAGNTGAQTLSLYAQ